MQSDISVQFSQDRHISGLYRVAEWNLCGFKSARNPYYTVFKQNVVNSFYHDFYICPETHCLNDENVEFDNYTVYSNNRVPHANITRGSGGIAIAVHNSVLQCHTLLSIFKGIDGQLAIKLKCKETEVKIGVFGLYLSPDSYRYGQDAEGFSTRHQLSGKIFQIVTCYWVQGMSIPEQKK